MKKISFIFLGFIFSTILVSCSGDRESITNVKELINVNQFYRIPEKELISIMGEPEKTDEYEWEIPSIKKKILGKLMIYENNRYEFLLFDEKVARLNIYSDKYNDRNGSSFLYSDEEDIFKMLAIESTNVTTQTVDNGTSLRYRPVSDTVEELRVPVIDNGQFDEVRVTYDLRYYN